MLRYNQLKRKLPGVTNMVLTNALKHLEEEGIVKRKQYNEIPPRVEYTLTEDGRRILPVLYVFSEKRMNSGQRFNCDKSCYNMFENYNNTIVKLDEIYLLNYRLVTTDKDLIELNTFDKIKYIFQQSFMFFDHIGKDAIRGMSTDFLREDNLKTSLNDRNRQLYQFIDQLITEGREKGEVLDQLSNHELIKLLIIFTRGVTYDWELSKEDYGVYEKNKNIIDYFFEKLKMENMVSQ
jgi:DNA-binding PadR family transcriptional regulator/ribosomal protein L17